jgi:hypothetical protein
MTPAISIAAEAASAAAPRAAQGFAAPGAGVSSLRALWMLVSATDVLPLKTFSSGEFG